MNWRALEATGYLIGLLFERTWVDSKCKKNNIPVALALMLQLMCRMDVCLGIIIDWKSNPEKTKTHI